MQQVGKAEQTRGGGATELCQGEREMRQLGTSWQMLILDKNPAPWIPENVGDQGRLLGHRRQEPSSMDHTIKCGRQGRLLGYRFKATEDPYYLAGDCMGVQDPSTVRSPLKTSECPSHWVVPPVHHYLLILHCYHCILSV